MNEHTPLPDHQGYVDPARNRGLGSISSGPSVRTTMSMDELAKAQAQIAAVVKERDDLLQGLSLSITDHNRTKDRLQLVQNELEKAQADAKMWQRVATKFATLISAIHMLSKEAKAVADAAAREGQMEGETAAEVEAAATVAKRFAPVQEMYEGGGVGDPSFRQPEHSERGWQPK